MQTINRLIIVACTVLSCGISLGEQPHEKWLKYFSGVWDYEISPVGERGTIEYRSVAGGNAVVAEYRSTNNTSAVETMGWDSHRKLMLINGYGSSDGSFWRVEIDSFDGDSYSGKHFGVLPNGSDFECTFEMKKFDENRCQWKLTGRATDGTPLRLTGTWTRQQ